MEQFVIQGGRPLNGTVRPSGNKNAAFPVLAASLLTEEPVIVHNVPEIEDVRNFRRLLSELDVEVERLSPGSFRLQARTVSTIKPNPELFGQIRGSLVLTGALLGRQGQVSLPAPGGDVIGRRRVDTHILALQELGVTFVTNDVMHLKADRLRGADILLDEASVTGTENTVMAAALAKGTTIINNAASEPHVQDLCTLLNLMGAQIEGIGSQRSDHPWGGSPGTARSGRSVPILWKSAALSGWARSPTENYASRTRERRHLHMPRLMLCSGWAWISSLMGTMYLCRATRC